LPTVGARAEAMTWNGRVDCVVLFVALQRYYIAGLSTEAVKG
jgi:ABC-type maltose transport system permease subunit